MGGTNNKENLIELTIPEHAEAHRILFEKYGKVEDKYAWLMLAGRTEEAEIARIELAKKGFNKFIQSERGEEWKKNNGGWNKGRKTPDHVKKKISDGNKRAIKNGKKINFYDFSHDWYLEQYKKNRSKMAEGRRKSKKWKNSVTSIEYRENCSKNSPLSHKIEIEGKQYNSI